MTNDARPRHYERGLNVMSKEPWELTWRWWFVVGLLSGFSAGVLFIMVIESNI